MREISPAFDESKRVIAANGLGEFLESDRKLPRIGVVPFGACRRRAICFERSCLLCYDADAVNCSPVGLG